MANPSGNNHHNETAQPSHHHHAAYGGGGNSINNPVAGSPDPGLLQINPGISTDWTPDEQSILEDGLSKYATESNIIRFAKIAVQLPNKNVRDVALRCRWMTKKENSKRRKEEHSLMRKSKDRKEKMTDSSANSSHLIAQTGFPPYAQGMVTNGNANGMLYSAIGGATGQLLQQNAQALEQISANLETLQLHENISLFCQARDNILKILNNLGDVPEKMKQMPALPVKLDEKLANSILPHTMPLR